MTAAMLEKNYLWRVYWRLAGVIMVCVVIALAVVSYFSHRVFDRELVPEVEQKAATVGNSIRALLHQGHELRRALRQALRRRADLRRDHGGQPRIQLCRRHRPGRPDPLRARQGARRRARVLPPPHGARHRPGSHGDLVGFAHRHRSTSSRMPVGRREAPGHAAHRHRQQVRGQRAARGDARRGGGARGLALLHARAAQLHGGRAPCLGPGRVLPPGRAHALGRLHRHRAHPRQRRDRAPTAAHRRGHRPPERALRVPRGRARRQDALGHGRAPRGAQARHARARIGAQPAALRLRAQGQRGRRDEPEPHPRAALRLHPRRGDDALLPAHLREPAAACRSPGSRRRW